MERDLELSFTTMAYNLVQAERTIESIKNSIRNKQPETPHQQTDERFIEMAIGLGQRQISSLELILKSVEDVLLVEKGVKDE